MSKKLTSESVHMMPSYNSVTPAKLREKKSDGAGREDSARVHSKPLRQKTDGAGRKHKEMVWRPEEDLTESNRAGRKQPPKRPTSAFLWFQRDPEVKAQVTGKNRTTELSKLFRSLTPE